jgi:hypothetical protein
MCLASTVRGGTQEMKAPVYVIGMEANQLRFDSKSIRSWRINGIDVLDTPVTSPFSVQEAAGRDRAEVIGEFAFKGDAAEEKVPLVSSKKRERQEQGRVEFDGTAANLDIQIKAEFAAQSNGLIRCNFDVIDLSGKDRTIDLVFALPIKPSAWEFGTSWEESGRVRVLPNKTYSQISTIKGGPQEMMLGVSCSQMPLISMDNGKQGLMLAHSMLKPCMYNYSIAVDQHGKAQLKVRVPLGIVGETARFPHRAPLELFLGAYPGGTYQRGALDLYYRSFPEAFAFRGGYPGGWGLWVQPESMQTARQYGIGFNEREWDIDVNRSGGVEGLKRILKATHDAGIDAHIYSEPWGVYVALPPGWISEPGNHTGQKWRADQAAVNTEALKVEIDKGKGSENPSHRFVGGVTQGFVVDVIHNTAIECDPDKSWRLNAYIPKGFEWSGTNFPNAPGMEGWDYAMIVANSDPQLPHPNIADLYWDKSRIGYVKRLCAEIGEKMEGLYVDSEVYFAGWNEFNFRRDHWSVADIPLAYARRDDGAVFPAQPVVLMQLAYLAKNREWAHENDWSVSSNTFDPITPFVAPYFDIIGAGEHGAGENGDIKKMASQTDFRIIRQLSFRKPVTVMDYVFNMDGKTYPVTATETRNIIEPRLNYYLMYGVYPGFCWWFPPAGVELTRPIFELYARLTKAINTAGWEPLTGAKLQGQDAATLLCEQWGNNPSTGEYFTIFNPSDHPCTCELELGSKILQKAAGAHELISGNPLPVGKKGFAISVDSGRTILVKLDPPGGDNPREGTERK